MTYLRDCCSCDQPRGCHPHAETLASTAGSLCVQCKGGWWVGSVCMVPPHCPYWSQGVGRSPANVFCLTGISLQMGDVQRAYPSSVLKCSPRAGSMGLLWLLLQKRPAALVTRAACGPKTQLPSCKWQLLCRRQMVPAPAVLQRQQMSLTTLRDVESDGHNVHQLVGLRYFAAIGAMHVCDAMHLYCGGGGHAKTCNTVSMH